MQDEVQTALESFFRVGESGGKTPDRFDELMKARVVSCVIAWHLEGNACGHGACALATVNAVK